MSSLHKRAVEIYYAYGPFQINFKNTPTSDFRNGINNIKYFGKEPKKYSRMRSEWNILKRNYKNIIRNEFGM